MPADAHWRLVDRVIKIKEARIALENMRLASLIASVLRPSHRP